MESSNVEWWSRGSDILAITGIILGCIVALVAVGGWFFSWKAGKLKDEAFEKFKLESAAAISSADTKAADANRIAAQAHKQAAQLEKDAAIANLELAKLRAKLAPRELTEKQRKIIRDALVNIPRGPVSVCVPFGIDTLSARYADSISSFLKSIGFDISQAVIPYPLNPGMVIEVKDPNSPPWAEALQHAFGIAGLKLSGQINEREDGKSVTIIIGPTDALLSP